MGDRTTDFSLLVRKLLQEPELVIDIDKWIAIIRSINCLGELEKLLEHLEEKFRPKGEIDCYPACFPLTHAAKSRMRELHEGG